MQSAEFTVWISCRKPPLCLRPPKTIPTVKSTPGRSVDCARGSHVRRNIHGGLTKEESVRRRRGQPALLTRRCSPSANRPVRSVGLTPFPAGRICFRSHRIACEGDWSEKCRCDPKHRKLLTRGSHATRLLIEYSINNLEPIFLPFVHEKARGK